MSLKKGAICLPADKKRKTLNKLTAFEKGDINIISQLPKTTRFLFSAREVASLSGSLVHFATAHQHLVSNIVPFYRLLDN